MIRILWALVALFLLAGCDSGRRAEGLGWGMGLLGSDAQGLTSGRPASREGLVAAGGPRSDRAPFVRMGTGRFVNATSGAKAELSDDGKRFSLNFADVELQEFIRVTFDEVLKENVVIDPSLKGRVTIRTAAPVSRTAALDLIRQAIRPYGASVSKAGDVYRIARRSGGGPAPRLGTSLRIAPVSFLDLEEARNALAPFAGEGIEITANPRGRYLLLAGPEDALDNLQGVLASLDVDQFKGMSIALLPLKDADAENVAKEVSAMFKASGADGDDRFQVMAISRMNAVLILSPRPAWLEEARDWVKRLDASGASGRKIYVYPVQNRRAADLANVLNEIITGESSADASSSDGVAPGLTSVGNERNGGSILERTGDGAKTANGSGSSSRSSRNRRRSGGNGDGFRITADVATNSVVTVATEEEYRTVQAALRRLDVVPTQVLIEATIAEVTLNNELRHGVRWYFESGNHGAKLTDSESGSLDPTYPGFNYVFDVPRMRVVLNALEGITNVEVVSSPALTVLDNQTAKLQVGDQVPILTRSSQGTTDPDSPIVSDVEMKDTGVILSVTPRVNPSGLVLLDITQEVSDVAQTKSSSIDSPTIRQRKVTSSVSVHSGSEIVLGGLISSARSRGKSGIPILMELPVIGKAFQSNVNRSNDRSELLIILRPTVIANRRDVEAITSEIKAKLNRASGAMYR